MKLTIPLLSVAFYALSARAELQERAVDCPAFLDTAAAAAGGTTAATNFCRVYLNLTPKTIVSTSTGTRTRTVTQATYTTTVLPITPDAVTKVKTTFTTTQATITPATKTQTQTITSTAYLAPGGETIALMKRDASPTELAARAIATPIVFRGMQKAAIRENCGCFNLVAPTVTRQAKTMITQTATKILQRKVIKTTTLAVPVVSQTAVVIKTKTVTLAAPKAIATAVDIEPIEGCPPTSTSTWLCPDGTGDDDDSDPNFETCAVLAQDGFSGNCLYWADDGSPAASTLVLGDGSGESENDQTREAVYGDDDTDDCPSWANWTCAPNPIKRSSLEVLVDEALAKRGFSPKKISKKGKKAKKMPKGLARGGKYVPYSTLATRGLVADEHHSFEL